MVDTLKKDYIKQTKLNKKNISAKNKEIKSLMVTIRLLKNLPKPIYPKEGIKVQKCVVFIMPVGETDENFNIKSIGK